MKKIIIYLIFIAAFSCKKEQDCETWQFYDVCTPKNSQTFCTNPPNPNYTTGPFCGNNLTGIYPGATKTIHEDADAKIVRHFVKKM